MITAFARLFVSGTHVSVAELNFDRKPTRFERRAIQHVVDDIIAAAIACDFPDDYNDWIELTLDVNTH